MCKHLKQDYSLSLQILCQNEIYMKKYPCVLSIAGSDCSGGAGIQSYLKTISVLGGYAATAITAITVQNTLGVQCHTSRTTGICTWADKSRNGRYPSGCC